jgi:hypothetical protein
MHDSAGTNCPAYAASSLDVLQAENVQIMAAAPSLPMIDRDHAEVEVRTSSVNPWEAASSVDSPVFWDEGEPGTPQGAPMDCQFAGAGGTCPFLTCAHCHRGAQRVVENMDEEWS